MILIGALLLWSLNWIGGTPLSFLDSLFTATSAVCVTGLSVVDTGKDLVPLSQVVLLLLIQLGGLGVMTATTLMLLVLRRRIGIRQRLLFAGGMGLDSPSGAIRLVIRIVKTTLLIEILFAVPLFVGFMRMYDFGTSIWYSIFHSVSAFCNAGFSPFGDSLAAFSSQWLIPGAVMALIILGGAGFVVMGDIWEFARHGKRLSVYSRLVVITTLSLIFLGAFFFVILEWNGALGGLSFPMKLWNGLFCSVTTRTAGFNTVSFADFSPQGVFLAIILMIIGASPGSTGGGIKTTTFGLLVSSAFFNTQGSSKLVLWHRTIPNETLLKAMMLFFLYLTTIVSGGVALGATEDLPFMAVIFEVVSALGTVGLSMGITGGFSFGGKLVLILLMFWGRVGILTFMFGLMGKDGADNVDYADVSVPIG